MSINIIIIINNTVITFMKKNRYKIIQIIMITNQRVFIWNESKNIKF